MCFFRHVIFCEAADGKMQGYLHPLALEPPSSPAHSKPFFAVMTAMISLITAAAAMVPCTILAHSGAGAFKTETAMPVNTKETPEWGRRVRPRYFLTVSGDFVMLASK